MTDERIITAKDIEWTTPREGVLRGAYNGYGVSIIQLSEGGWTIVFGSFITGKSNSIHVWNDKQSAKEVAIEIINIQLSLERNDAPVCDICGKECYYDGDNDWQYSCECHPGWYDAIDTGR